MLRRLHRFVIRVLPALLVAAAWLGWWIVPETPLRVCPLDVPRFFGGVTRPAHGEWAILMPAGPNAHPGLDDFVVRFDPIAGGCEKLPTPCRGYSAFSADLTRWAWGDDTGAVHVATLPKNQIVFVTPPNPLELYPEMTFTPDGRWLLTGFPSKNQCDIWDAATGVKRGAIIDNTAEVHGWSFRADGCLRIIWFDGPKSCFRVTSFRLPEEKPVETVEVPWSPGQVAACPSDEPYLWVANKVTAKIWDITSSPARPAAADVRPLRREFSQNGRYRLTSLVEPTDVWWFEDLATGQTVLQSPEHRTTNPTIPSFPAFSSDNRFLLLTHWREGILSPTWVPTNSFRRWWSNRSFGQTSASIALVDTATGDEARTIGGWHLVQLAPNSDRFWIMTGPLPTVGSARLEEYPIAPPRPPWWLGALTAVAIGWYLRQFGRWRAVRRNPQAIAVINA